MIDCASVSARAVAGFLAAAIAVCSSTPDARPQSPSPKRKLSTREALIRRQAESGLTLLTIADGEIKFVDFSAAALRTLKKLDPTIRPYAPPHSAPDYWIDREGKTLIGNRRLDEGSWAIFIANLEDGSVKLIKDNYAGQPSLSPNGRFLAYHSGKSQKSKYGDLWRLDLATNVDELLSLNWPARPAQWSSDSRYLLFDHYIEIDERYNNAVALFDTQSKTERVLAKGASSASWKPSSTEYAYIADNAIVQTSLDENARQEKLWTSNWVPPLHDCPVVYSHSGDFIAFVRGSASDALNIKGFSVIELVVKGDGKPVRVYGPYERNKKLTFSWAEVPAVKKAVSQR